MSKEDTQKTIGKLLDGEHERDAIHIAVAPVIAGEKLYAGDHIGLVQGLAKRCDDGVAIGIVDPFLTRPVQESEQFWMFLYPNTITSLKHLWTHPAFDAAQTVAVARDVVDARQLAIDWMHIFAARAGLSYDQVIEIGRESLSSGYFYTEQGSTHAQDAYYEDPDLFWENFALITGFNKPDDPSPPFSCIC